MDGRNVATAGVDGASLRRRRLTDGLPGVGLSAFPDRDAAGDRGGEETGAQYGEPDARVSTECLATDCDVHCLAFLVCELLGLRLGSDVLIRTDFLFPHLLSFPGALLASH
jgi:hypothetical protein